MSTSTPCLYLAGNIASGDRPCDTGDQYPSCCAEPTLCTTGGLCLEGGTVGDPGSEAQYAFGRGTCTNLDSPNCLHICNQTSSGGIGVWACNDALTTFCCDDSPSSDYSRTCCTDGSPTFQLPSPVLLDSASSSTSSLIFSTSPSSTFSTTTMPTSSAAPTAAASPSSSPSKGTNGTDVGLGVGITLGVVLLAALAWFLWRKHRRLSSRRDMQGQLDFTQIDTTAGPKTKAVPPSELDHRLPVRRDDSALFELGTYPPNPPDR